MVVLIFLLCVLGTIVVGQTVWAVSNHYRKYLKYHRAFKHGAQEFNKAFNDWVHACELGDRDSMQKAFAEEEKWLNVERHMMRAQQAVIADNFIWPWRWP